MRFYLVFDHYYSGIIQSQVLDVVKMLKDEFNVQIKVVVFLNVKRYVKERSKYLSASDQVYVLPNFGFSRWKWSFPFLAILALIYRPSHVVGRSVFAFHLGYLLKKFRLTKTVGLDARGAEYAEWKEYFFPNDEGPVKHEEIRSLERLAVEHSSPRLAVSNKLVNYWINHLGVNKEKMTDTLIVPSTLSLSASESASTVSRSSLDIPDQAVLFIFSGSSSDWHGIQKLLLVCEHIKELNDNAYFLFLTNGDIQFSKSGKVKSSFRQLWVKPEEVESFLQLGDYGLLIRSQTITNQVSSPVKYAEYLRAGLHILISPEMGDLSDFTHLHGCGYVVRDEIEDISLMFSKRTLNERMNAQSLALEHFSKSSHLWAYADLFNLKPRII